MVVKTELCSFTEYKVYPGRGTRFVAKDGRMFLFISHKAVSLFQQKIKPVKLTWSQAWRRYNKKTKAEETKKKERKTQVKVQKAIVGASLDEIQKRKNLKQDLYKKSREVAMKEIKERTKQRQEKAKAQQPVAAKGAKVSKQDKKGKK